MAKADYILCDRCDCKIVYDGEGAITKGLAALGLDKAPALCELCRANAAAKDGVNAAVGERNGLLDGAMLAAGMGQRLTLTQAAIMREADKRVEVRIAETEAMVSVLNWCRNRMGSLALNDELEERLVGLGIDMPRDGRQNG